MPASDAEAPSRRIRVLHIIVHLSAGGAELMMKRLILAQRDNPAFTHAVISLRGLGTVGPQLREAGIEVVALGGDSPLRLLAKAAPLVRRIRRFRPTLVQTWMYHADLVGGLAARVAGCRGVIWNVRIAQIGPDLGVARATRWIMKLCAALSRTIPSRIVYVAESARLVHEHAGYDQAKGIVIPNGYAIPPLDPSARERLHRALGVSGGGLLVGSAGRFNAQKNHHGFVTACGAIAANVPEAQFVMFGAGVDRSNRQLAEWIAETGHADRFHLLGERGDFTELVQGLDLFCLHSLSEGFPNVVAEAMAGGVPCVVTDVGDAAPLVADTGWTVPCADEAQLAGALEAALRLDGDTRRGYGARARDRIAGLFSMPTIADTYAGLYREVAGETACAARGAI